MEKFLETGTMRNYKDIPVHVVEAMQIAMFGLSVEDLLSDLQGLLIFPCWLLSLGSSEVYRL